MPFFFPFFGHLFIYNFLPVLVVFFVIAFGPIFLDSSQILSIFCHFTMLIFVDFGKFFLFFLVNFRHFSTSCCRFFTIFCPFYVFVFYPTPFKQFSFFKAIFTLNLTDISSIFRRFFAPLFSQHFVFSLSIFLFCYNVILIFFNFSVIFFPPFCNPASIFSLVFHVNFPSELM